MKRSRLERRTALRSDPVKVREWRDRSRKSLPLKSEKQRRIDRERAELKAVLLAEHARAGRVALRQVCAAADLVPEVVCASVYSARPVVEMHEVVKRSRWRRGAVDPGNVVLLCQAHHDWTEDEVDEASRRGLLASGPPVDPREGRF